jgi:ribosomal protein L37AE/L43A
MGYSKESQRQNKVLGDLLSGKTPQKRIMVGYEGKTESGDKISRLSDVMKEARMPMFCPKCDVIMKKRLDNKFWSMYGHCFNCQVKIENKMRIDGTYKDWEKNKIKQNKISYLKEQIQAIEEWRDTKAPTWYNNVGVNTPELEEEKWDIDIEKIKQEADDALEKYNEALDKLENEE